MTNRYAVRLPIAKGRELGRLRTSSGLDVQEDGEWIWVRACDPDESLLKLLRSLPGTHFRVWEDKQLCEIGARVPHGFAPGGEWNALSRWMAVELPPSALSGEVRDRVAFRLVPGAKMREPNLLLTSLSAWSAYGIAAPQVRLDRWHFAVSEAGEALVRGVPLPPLPGLRLIEEQGVAVPCGRCWSPAVDADVVASHFGLSAGDVLLWLDDDRRELVAAESFVRAARSAIRQSDQP